MASGVRAGVSGATPAPGSGLRGAGADRTASERSGTNVLVRSASLSGLVSGLSSLLLPGLSPGLSPGLFSRGGSFSAVVAWSTRSAAPTGLTALKMAVG